MSTPAALVHPHANHAVCVHTTHAYKQIRNSKSEILNPKLPTNTRTTPRIGTIHQKTGMHTQFFCKKRNIVLAQVACRAYNPATPGH